ncbi:PD-(D/E)XK nuclease family protein [Chlorogloeopsis sp. ULAP01]|uniref:PD-(D/E)XK nuclease family protein n=1 Tax=Chlorogloeopsis sp. ULAP01 TaxID=3056483 RepID=UPI0025AB31F1|nr:PD-(D/E)XK nuclease family protein [Chlorogloeopsis sp. ULAP01]MDM9382503.1 PD-(D/E)XK nuclease family protein [Chlorogloeopsis sp. ULAP01]
MVWRPYVSFNIWSQFVPPVGKEYWHCDMKRGFTRARKKELLVKSLLEQDTIPQQIGLLAQKGIYEFHQDIQLLCQSNGVEIVAQKLKLAQESAEVQQRVMKILENYYQSPILLGKKIIQLSRGDEGIPEPILIQQGNYFFNLFAAIDCIFIELNGKLHILDFKTGKSDFDRRQAFVYLLAATYLYPQQKAVASFYNLENGKQSELITATDAQLKAIQEKLVQIAQEHQKELQRYKKNPSDFADIFPANPGISCRHCQFTSICQFYQFEVSA